MTSVQIEQARSSRAIWDRVERNGPVPLHRPELGPCWVWLGAIQSQGYGTVHVAGGQVYVHRLSFMVDTGILLTSSTMVLHHCDNPPCCRPSHLFSGTSADNTADAVSKSRVARGVGLPQAKLTEAAVVEIKRSLRDGVRGLDLADHFGVTQQAICDIKHGRNWAWVHV